MATRLIAKESGGEKPAARKAPSKKGIASKKATANGSAASAKGMPALKAKKCLPAATIRALAQLEVGELNRYADADEMFRQLGHKRGRREPTLSPSKTASATGGRVVKTDQASLNPRSPAPSSRSTSPPRTIGGWTNSPPRP